MLPLVLLLATAPTDLVKSWREHGASQAMYVARENNSPLYEDLSTLQHHTKPVRRARAMLHVVHELGFPPPVERRSFVKSFHTVAKTYWLGDDFLAARDCVRVVVLLEPDQEETAALKKWFAAQVWKVQPEGEERSLAVYELAALVTEPDSAEHARALKRLDELSSRTTR